MLRFVQRRVPRVAALVGACIVGACTEQVRLGVDAALSDGASGRDAGVSTVPGTLGRSGASGASGVEFPLGGAGGASVDIPPATPLDAGPCVPLACGGAIRPCGDCEDNDEDGRVDASDPECLGPCDESESELQSGAVNVTGACRADCYFDLNSGSGDDRCGWSFRCDPLSVAPDFDPTGSAMCDHDPTLAICAGSELGPCLERCLPLTPNGCDCFGCCELPAGSGRFVWLGSGDDQRPCTPVPDCQNTCDECELCVGRTTLLPSCSGTPGPACAPGVRACDPQGLADCGINHYCITGCCVPLPT
jgi:hypothetical protein